MAKEKKTKEIRVMVQPSLYKKFKKQCDGEYKTISEVVRDFMDTFVKMDSGKKIN